MTFAPYTNLLRRTVVVERISLGSNNPGSVDLLMGTNDFSVQKVTDTEWSSVEEFGEFLLGEDRTSFTFDEACDVAASLGHSVPTLVIRVLKEYGFRQEARAIPRRVRTISTSSHDRFFGPGSAPMHGGSGWEQISGFAGQEG